MMPTTRVWGLERGKTNELSQKIAKKKREKRPKSPRAGAPPARHEVEDKAGPVVAEVLHYINEHYPDELSLDLLSAKFFISKYHLSHEFHRLVGTSVYRYIIQKRLVIAKQMLANGVAPTDVYGHCGFGDYANFYRAFKAEYHISPKQFLGRAGNENTFGG